MNQLFSAVRFRRPVQETMASLVRVHPVNTLGTDFLVGDIHGSFSALEETLERVGFDRDRDRLFSVGDLIDRGPESQAAADWIAQPWFFPIRGNHEDLFLLWWSLRDQRPRQRQFERETYFTRNGGGWAARPGAEWLEAFAITLQRLPHMAIIPTSSCAHIGLVHAQLPDGWIWPDLMAQPARPAWVEEMLWGRTRLMAAVAHSQNRESAAPGPLDDNRIMGLAAVVCGHATVHDPVALGNCLYIDTGGWRQQGRFSVVPADSVLAMVGWTPPTAAATKGKWTSTTPPALS